MATSDMPRPDGGSRENRPTMCIAILVTWALAAWWFDRRIWDLVLLTPGYAARVALLLLGACLNFFWLMACYQAALMLFTMISARRKRTPAPPLESRPRVAVLYTTMHDFQERAALSCINQDYDNFHVYLLDDSVDGAARQAVDDFASRHVGRATVVRRSNREGFKAGSLNHALAGIAANAEFFAVADADSVLPPDFIRRLLPHLIPDPSIGWVQASHRPHPDQHSVFARDLCLGIVPLWTVYYGPKNEFGFVPFLGHGGMIRTSAWRHVGGVPELVSEDLCLSTRLAQLGYRGVFAADVICYEDFPEGYRQLRRQQEKYIKGACEFLHRESLPFFASERVSWHQKFDVLLSCLSLFTPVVHLFFLFTFCLLVPLLLGGWELLTVGMFGHSVSINVLTPGAALLSLWSRDFYWMTVACTVAPVLGAIGTAWQWPVRGGRMLLLSAVPYLSLMVVATGAVLAYLVSKRAVFLVTGDRWGAESHNWPRGFSPSAGVPERIGSEDRSTQLVEIAAGLLLSWMCLVTANLTLLGLALGMGLGPVLLRTRWEARWLRPFLYLPFAMVWVGLILGTPMALAGQGAYASVFIFHF